MRSESPENFRERLCGDEGIPNLFWGKLLPLFQAYGKNHGRRSLRLSFGIRLFQSS